MGTSEAPEKGAVMWDTARDRVGRVVDVDGPIVRLRPGDDGSPWRARAADLRLASPADELRLKVAEINSRHAQYGLRR
jgi:hypothetical protein